MLDFIHLLKVMSHEFITLEGHSREQVPVLTLYNQRIMSLSILLLTHPRF